VAAVVGEVEDGGEATTQQPLPSSPGEARDQCGGHQEGRLDRILTVLDSMTDMTEFLKVKLDLHLTTSIVTS
jgi:hypothetical protein